jgi:CubicO group peptidase (beta-lactamase class C family)
MFLNSRILPASMTAALAAMTMTMGLSGCATDTGSSSAEPAQLTQWPALETAATEVFTPDELAALESRMVQFVEEGHTAGIATLLVKGGEPVHYKQHGIRNAETGAPITEDTIYRIYSMTKPVTGVAMMLLYEEGKISLDDPVSKYIPEFENLQVLGPQDENGAYSLVSLERQPTIRELMSHSAGFAYGLFDTDPANQAFREKQVLASPDLDTFIDSVAGIPLLYQPGERWYYSAAVDIQGAIIERISGMSLGEFMQTRIFAPLAMEDTGFYVPADKYERFSDVFGYHPETKEFGPYRAPPVAFRKETIGMESGGGGLVSTMRDYARFCQMLANGGMLSGVRLLQEDTVIQMRTNVLADGIKVNLTGNFSEERIAGLGFGLDFGIVADAEASPSPYGQGTYFWGGAAGTWFWIDPEHDLFFIGMIQRFPANGPEVDFRSISAYYVYEALKTP